VAVFNVGRRCVEKRRGSLRLRRLTASPRYAIPLPMLLVRRASNCEAIVLASRTV